MDILLISISTAVFVLAGGVLINRYWSLMGFRGTAACGGAIIASFLVPLLYNDDLLLIFGPYLMENSSMWTFRFVVIGTGLGVTILLLLLFERNYWKLEERLKSKSPVVVVQAPSGPTAEQIAEAVARRVAVPTAAAPPIPPKTPPAPSFEQRISARTAEILPRLTSLASQGERIYLDMIGDPRQVENFPRYQTTIEEWRTRLGNTYDAELPNSGARSLGLPHTGTLGIGPIGFELSRLVKSIEGQRQVIQNLETYVRRSLTH